MTEPEDLVEVDIQIPEVDLDEDLCKEIREVATVDLPKLISSIINAALSVDGLEPEDRTALQIGCVARIAVVRMGVTKHDPYFNELCMQAMSSAAGVVMDTLFEADSPEEWADLIAKNLDKIHPESSVRA